MHYLFQAGCKAIVSYLMSQWVTPFGCNIVVNFSQCNSAAIDVETTCFNWNTVKKFLNRLIISLIFCDTNFRVKFHDCCNLNHLMSGVNRYLSDIVS